MNRQKRTRSRGLVFTPEGWQKVRAKIKIWQHHHKSGKKCTLEDLSEITGLSYNTVLKIQERRKGVDKRSLVKFALSFGLQLSSQDWVSSSSLNRSTSRQSPIKVDWDEPIELASFYGRETELSLLKQWLVKDRCRLVAVQGIGGIGKTTLCAKLVEQVEHKFDRVIWRSLHKISSLKELILELLQVLDGQSQSIDADNLSIRSCIQLLIKHLRSHQCLIVLDCLDTTMVGGKLCGSYATECQNYYKFIKYLGETVHQSCLLLITREKPREIRPLEGKALPVRSFCLGELSQQAARQILSASDLLGTETEQNSLIKRFCGHPLALKIAARKIHTTCNGEIGQFLPQEIVIEELERLWSNHLERLSVVEQEILRKLASCNEPASFSVLKQEIPASIPFDRVIDSLESLLGRSLIVRELKAFSVYPQLPIAVDL